MKASPPSRLALFGLILLGLSLELVVPIALEPDHYLEHSSSAPAATEERVSLHGEDGDHHHEKARLELGETARHAHCGLCAQIGKSQVLLNKKLAWKQAPAERRAPIPADVFLDSLLGREPLQPRAPPRA